MERTLGIIKPNSVKKDQVGRILTMGEEAGLKIVEMKMKTLTQEEASGFYAEHRERPFFQSLVSFMTSGPVVLLIWQGQGAVEKWRQVMGATDPAKAAPGTIRKLFADSIEANSVHGSDSATSAKRETEYFFS